MASKKGEPFPAPKHSESEQQAIFEMIVRRGPAHSTYLQWCEETGIPPERRLSYDGWKHWRSRFREGIEDVRAKVFEEEKADSLLGRNKRLMMLEEITADLLKLWQKGKEPTSYDREGNEVKQELTVASRTKIANEIRRNLEMISRERGEWGEKPQTNEEKEAAETNKALHKIFANYQPEGV